MSEVGTRWGFHRLDERWAARLVDDAHIQPGHLVLDLGAGTGALTRPLIERGARVIAFERHPARLRELRRRFVNDTVTIVDGDVADLRLPRRPFRVVANPPFSLSVAILRRLTSSGSQLVRADVIVPAHLAERWIEGSSSRAARDRRRFAASWGRSLPRRAFHPPPPGGVAVLVLTRRVGPTRG